MADPGALLALAAWHRAAARLAAEASGESSEEVLGAYRPGDRLPVDPPAASVAPLPLALRFGSDLLVPDDAPFMAALHARHASGRADDVAALVADWADRSLVAWLARESRQGGDRLKADAAVDLARKLRDDLLRRARVRTEGQAQGHHRQFADIAHVGALRALALVAEVEGDREASGLLRLRAWELSEKATACPVGLLSLAAWDAGNRYPVRALDIVHTQSSRSQSISAAAGSGRARTPCRAT